MMWFTQNGMESRFTAVVGDQRGLGPDRDFVNVGFVMGDGSNPDGAPLMDVMWIYGNYREF